MWFTEHVCLFPILAIGWDFKWCVWGKTFQFVIVNIKKMRMPWRQRNKWGQKMQGLSLTRSYNVIYVS